MENDKRNRGFTGSGSLAGDGSGSGRLRGALAGLWRVSTSPVTFVVLTILWCVDLGAGSVVAYFNDPKFWVKMDLYPFNLWMKQVAPRMFPQSLWIYILVILSYLMIASLLLCTVNWFLRRRKMIKGLGEVLVHLGFLMIFAGFVIGSALGARDQVTLAVGQKKDVPGMGLSLQLEDLKIVQSPQGRPVDTLSDIKVYRDNSIFTEGRIRTNHPLIWGSTVVYPPEDYGSGVTGGVIGTSVRGAVILGPGRSVSLGGDRTLSLGGVLQRGQRRGRAVGPGLLVLLKDGAGRLIDSTYLSPAPGMRAEDDMAGVRVTLGELSESTYGVFRVHRDQGVWLVIVGTVILGLGTLWALAGYLGVLPGVGEGSGS